MTKDQIRKQLFALIEDEVTVIRSIQVASNEPLGREAEEFISWIAGMFDAYRALTNKGLTSMDSKPDCDNIDWLECCCHSKGEKE